MQHLSVNWLRTRAIRFYWQSTHFRSDPLWPARERSRKSPFAGISLGLRSCARPWAAAWFLATSNNENNDAASNSQHTLQDQHQLNIWSVMSMDGSTASIGHPHAWLDIMCAGLGFAKFSVICVFPLGQLPKTSCTHGLLLLTVTVNWPPWISF